MPLLPPPIAPPFFAEGADTIPLYRVLSRILHSNSIEALRSAEDYDFQAATSEEIWLQMIVQRMGQKPERSEPLILLKGEKDPTTTLRIKSVVTRSCAFLNVVSDRLSEDRRIFLQRDYREI